MRPSSSSYRWKIGQKIKSRLLSKTLREKATGLVASPFSFARTYFWKTSFCSKLQNMESLSEIRRSRSLTATQSFSILRTMASTTTMLSLSASHRPKNSWSCFSSEATQSSMPFLSKNLLKTRSLSMQFSECSSTSSTCTSGLVTT